MHLRQRPSGGVVVPRPLPVLATVRDAYGFAFSSLLQVYGQLFLAVLVTTVAYWVFQYNLDRFYQGTPDGGSLAAQHGAIALAYLVMFVGSVMLATGILRIKLKGRERSLLGLRFGACEWRLVAGYVVYIMFVYGAVLLFAALFLYLMHAAIVGSFALGIPIERMYATVIEGFDAGLPFSGWLILFLGLVIGFFVVVNLFMRPVLYVAVNIAEHRIGLLRSWRITRNNAFRLLFAYALMMLILAALVFGLWFLAVTLMDGLVEPAEQVPVLFLDMRLRLSDVALVFASSVLVALAFAVVMGFFGAAYEYLDDGRGARVNVKGLLSRVEDQERKTRKGQS